MTSPVDTSVKFIHSTQSGAPVLNGTAGALISVLDALLVTGWGLQTATSLVVAGGVATLAFSSSFPAVVDSVILVSGSSIAALNGEQKITAVGSGTVSFATAAADGAASGTITAKMAAAGWAKVFTGTNKAVYRSSDPMANGMYLRVDDSNAISARVVGYEQMVDVDTGTGPFPTAAQMPGGGYWAKSAIAQSKANGYFFAADTKFLLVHSCPGQYLGATYSGGNTHGFGDLISRRSAGDAFATTLNYDSNAPQASGTSGTFDGTQGATCAMPRDYTGLGSAVLRDRIVLQAAGNNLSGADSTFGVFPSYVDGSLILAAIAIRQAGSAPIRAIVPGIYYCPQNGLSASFSRGSRVPGSGSLAGKTLFAILPSAASSSFSTFGVSFVDITGPWR